MSVVDKIADLAVSPQKEEALLRLANAEAQLESSSGSGNARHAKLAALIDLDRYADVAKFADPQAHAGELAHYAYALYKLEQLAELREAVTQGGSGVPLAAKLALAQAEYKAGHLGAARRILEQCQPELTNDDLVDVRVNLSAIDALEGVSQGHVDEPTTFDEFFNRARYFLTRGLANEALGMLTQATALALDDDDRQGAVAQAVYAHLLLNQPEKVAELVDMQTKQLSHNELSAVLRPIVANNSLAASFHPKGDLVEYHQALKQYDLGLQPLNADQREVIRRNQLKLEARIGRKHALRNAERHLAEFAGDVEPYIVALHYTETAKRIRRQATTQGVLGDAARLLLQARNGSPAEYPAVTTLEPGNLGQLAAVLTGEFSPSDLVAYFEQFRDSQIKTAGLQLADPASVDIASIQHGIDALVESVDVDSLETQAFTASRNAQNMAQAPVSAAAPSRKPKQHKRKLPANADPNVQPDPERWLAKQDRSGYKAKRKKTQATQGGAATQGVTESAPQHSTGEVVSGKSRNLKKKKGKK